MESITETPRKTALKKRIRKVSLQNQYLVNRNRNLVKRNKRLKKKVASMSGILKHLKNKTYITDEQFTELNLNTETLNIFNRIISKKNSTKSFRQKYPPTLRKFAITLNFYSPAAYKYVRRVFHTALPHPRVLGKWYENTSVSPGFTTQAFDMLKQKYNISGKRMICALVADEMALRHQSKWTGRKTEGVVDFGGTTDSKVIATEAYVFLLVALDENWKLPVGYFFVKGVSSETRAHLIISCITKSFESGVDVVAVTFDGCPANFSTAKLLGCDLKDPKMLKTSFKHPDCDMQVVVLFDPCHMIKLVRNTFESKRIIFNQNNKEIKWHLLENLNNLQKDQGLKFANKLSERHLKFRNEIMKVKLATQLLSKSVANALELCEQLSIPKFCETAATVDFINIFNDLFDIFNSRSVHIFGFKKPICPQNASEIIQFLDTVKQYILSLKIYNKNRRQVNRRIVFSITKKNIVECKCKSGFLGFLVCIESLKYLYSSLVVEESRMSYISTYRLSQDHIEILFGDIRRHGGYNNNPNVIQFKGIYKKIVNHLELRSGFSGNCVPLESIPILNCTSAVLNINWSSGKRVSIGDGEPDLQIATHSNNMLSDKTSQDNVNIFSQILNNDSSPNYVKQIVGYISGWIARKLVSILKCEVCIQSLLTSNKLWFHKLVIIKDMGGLCYSSESTFIVCLRSENILKSHIKEKGLYFTKHNEVDILKNRILKTFVNSNVFNDLNDHTLTQPPTFNHRLHLIKAIIEKYVNVRLHSEHRNNPDLNTLSKRQKRNKLNLFEGV